MLRRTVTLGRFATAASAASPAERHWQGDHQVLVHIYGVNRGRPRARVVEEGRTLDLVSISISIRIVVAAVELTEDHGPPGCERSTG